MDDLNLTSKACSSPVTFHCIPIFNLFLKVLKNLENMVNVKCSNLTGIEAWTSGLIVLRDSRKTDQIPYLDVDCLPRAVIRDIFSKFFVFIMS